MTETMILTRSDVERLLGWDECIAAVEQAFRLHAEGKSLTPGVLGVRAPHGGFHIKAAGLELGRLYFAAKSNANYSDNPRWHGLPAIQGVIVLCDAGDGRLLALMDSIEVTIRRTAAATAVAARYMARPGSRTATICGCGSQGRAQLRAIVRVLPIECVFAIDTDDATASTYARELSAELGLDVSPTNDLAAALAESDVCVTCTPARKPFLLQSHVRPGTFVAAVGADNADKQELDAKLMAAGAVVADVLAQCAVMGDLHHALDAGVMSLDGVRGELADVVTGRKPGRCSEEEITIFDSTGTAIEDVAAAAIVYERAAASGAGLRVALGS